MPDINKVRVRYGQVNREYGLRLATTASDDDGPIWMVNLMSYREKADYADGREAEYSGRDADDRYAPLGPLKAIGAQPVFLADVDTQFLDDTTSARRCARGADVPAADARVAQAQLRP